MLPLVLLSSLPLLPLLLLPLLRTARSASLSPPGMRNVRTAPSPALTYSLAPHPYPVPVHAPYPLPTPPTQGLRAHRPQRPSPPAEAPEP
ncbi:hypothetical protein B484DRAFT_442753 [Ochromonadaceae sp. CCMP2298]|nr:hypothetical protein B484DRAFT_442753 [Ochromonadaceae sp. CCMP2298]